MRISYFLTCKHTNCVQDTSTCKIMQVLDLTRLHPVVYQTQLRNNWICAKPSLEKHTDDCHHCQPAICQLRCKLALASLRVLDLAQEVGETNAIVAWLSRLSGILHAEATLTRTTAISGRSCLEESSCLDQTSEGNDLSATQHWEPQHWWISQLRF